MKKDKRQHRKKPYSAHKKKTRKRTSSESSGDAATCCMTVSPSRHRDSASSSDGSTSYSRSSPARKRATKDDFLPALEFLSEEKPKSIALYIDNREEMVRHMFASLQRRELHELLPESMKNMEVEKLLPLCIDELEGMSRKRICAILEGKDFTESSKSEKETSVISVASINIKSSKAEIAVADSTTEMPTSNSTSLSIVHSHAIEMSGASAGYNMADSSEHHSDAVESSSLTRAQQPSEGFHQSIFQAEQVQSSPVPVHKQPQECACKSSSNANDQAHAVTTNEDDEDDDLEEGEVVSDRDMGSASSGASAQSEKRQNHSSSHSTPNGDQVASHDSSCAQKPKGSGNAGSSASTANKVRQERKLNLLELELRARAIEALMKRSDSKL